MIIFIEMKKCISATQQAMRFHTSTVILEAALKKILNIFSIAVIIAVICPLMIAVFADNGQLGALTYELSDDGLLTISGNGKMDGFTAEEGAPWSEKAQSILSVEIKDGVESIGAYAFYGCENLVSVSIAPSVLSVGKDAFLNTGIYNDIVNWADGALYISHVLIRADSEFNGRYSVDVDTRVIADCAFEDCDGVTGVTLPSNLKTIGDRAFFGCSSLSAVTVPSSVSKIGNAAFACSDGGIKSISVNSKNTHFKSVDGVLYSYDMSSVTVFPAQKASSEFTVPDGVEAIAPYAFFGCGSIESLTLPASLKTIGESSLDGCSSLANVYYSSTEENWEKLDIHESVKAVLKNVNMHYTEASADTTATPEDTTTIPEDTTTIPEDTTTIPEDTTTIPEDTTTIPEDTTTEPEDTATEPEDNTNVPEDTETAEGGTTSSPDGDTDSTRGDTSKPDEDVFNEETQMSQTLPTDNGASDDEETRSIVPSIIITVIIMVAAAVGVVLFIRRSYKN